jgi:hypothetical protein
MGKCLRFFLFTVIVLASSSMARAVTLSVGANLWYNWWIPSFRLGHLESVADGPNSSPPPDRYLAYSFTDARDADTLSTVTGGPALSIRIDRFSLSTVLVYAYYGDRSGGISTGRNYFLLPAWSPAAYASYGQSYLTIRRWDSDTTLSYSLTPMVSLLLGLKIQSYQLKARTASPAGVTKSSDRFLTAGPGLGAGLTIPLVSDIFLIWNNTGFVLWSRQDASKNVLMPLGLVNYYDDGSYIGLGVTSAIAGAWVLPSVSTTLALGFRYQMLWYRRLDDRPGFVNIDRKIDHNLGLTFSAIYTFDFSNDD